MAIPPQRPRYTSITRGIACTVARSPFGEHAALVQHRHSMRRDLRDEGHVVLDHHHRMCLPASDRQQLGGALGFLVGHAGHRLVEQQQLGLLDEQHADLEPLLLSVRQRCRHGGLANVEADGLQHFIDAARAASRSSSREQAASTLLSAFRRAQRFSNTLWCSNTVGFWNLRPMPGVSDLGFAHAGEVDRLAEEHLAGIGPRLAGDHVHHRGLAGAVGTDDGSASRRRRSTATDR
jgi:hypothetical protein